MHWWNTLCRKVSSSLCFFGIVNIIMHAYIFVNLSWSVIASEIPYPDNKCKLTISIQYLLNIKKQHVWPFHKNETTKIPSISYLKGPFKPWVSTARFLNYSNHFFLDLSFHRGPDTWYDFNSRQLFKAINFQINPQY